MVARDPLNQGSAFVTPIDLLNATPNEKSLFELGESHKIERQKRAKTSLLKTSPSPGESALIHSMFLDSIAQTAYSFRARVKPEGSIWMEETLLQNVLMNHPQERNIYGKMFGGYLMRQAFELALSNAVLFSEHLPSALSVADIDFQKPVEIGTLLFLSSQVVYTIDSFLQIKVHAEVVNPKKKLRETTNVFHFTFGTRQGEVVPTVLPKTYTEYMLYIDGKRHLEAAMPVQQ
jgi:acyl-coenzyme A thioesterase 9